MEPSTKQKDELGQFIKGQGRFPDKFRINFKTGESGNRPNWGFKIRPSPTLAGFQTQFRKRNVQNLDTHKAKLQSQDPRGPHPPTEAMSSKGSIAESHYCDLWQFSLHFLFFSVSCFLEIKNWKGNFRGLDSQPQESSCSGTVLERDCIYRIVSGDRHFFMIYSTTLSLLSDPLFLSESLLLINTYKYQSKSTLFLPLHSWLPFLSLLPIQHEIVL